MVMLYVLLASLALAHAQEARHQQITHITPVFSTVTKTVIPTCYEPAEMLNFCYRKKKQIAILYDPTAIARGMLPQVEQFETVPLSLQSLGKSGSYVSHYQNGEAPEVVPSFQQYPSQGGPPGEFLNFFGGFVTKTKTTVLVTATATAQKTQTVMLDCLHPGSYVPSNFCDVSMIFPSPPEGIALSQYCYILGQLAKVRVDACEEVTLSTGTSVYVRFSKGPYTPYPSRRLVMKYILMSLIKTCNLKVGKCQIPGLPYGWVLELSNIYIPGIANINTFITEILIEILGVGNGCPNNDPFTPTPFTLPPITTSMPISQEAENVINAKKATAAKKEAPVKSG